MLFQKIHKISTILALISIMGAVTVFFLEQISSVWRGTFLIGSANRIMDTLLWACLALGLGGGAISIILSSYLRSEK